MCRETRAGRVTLADFDITVTTRDGRSAAAQQIDASHWSACACQGGAVGATGTVTATYPAASLDARSRVPDVAFSTTASFSIAEAKGLVNPPACLASEASSAAATAAASSPATRGAGTDRPLTMASGPLRPTAYSPLNITVEPTFNAAAAWSQPNQVTVSFNLGATGTWSQANQVTVYFDLSAVGNWVAAPASAFTIP